MAIITAIKQAAADLHTIALALPRLIALWEGFIARERVSERVAAAAAKAPVVITGYDEEAAWRREQEEAQKGKGLVLR